MARNDFSLSFTEQGIAVLCIKRQENRINNEFLSGFNDCLDTVERTSSCNGLITTGHGKFYCNGLDTDWMATLDGETLSNFFKGFIELIARLLTFPLPTLAAINGHCYAGGALIALAHDLRVMNSERGWLCFNEVFLNRRFTPFTILFLKAKITHPNAFHHSIVFGKRFTGPEARANGLVEKAIPADLVQKEGQRLLKVWLGKSGFPRESLHNMKKDAYADALKELYTPYL